MSRPRRSCTLPQAKPDLDSILHAVYDCPDADILAQFQTVSKYFKGDVDALAEFWIRYTPYNLESEEHLYLLRWVFETVGLDHLLAIDYLHSMKKETLTRLAIVRVIIPNRIYYRFCTGHRL